MRLRLRVAVATVAVTLPMIGGLVWLDARARRAAAEDELVRLAYARIQLPGERERCEASPEAWGAEPSGPGRPPGPPPEGEGRPPPPPPGEGRPPPRRPRGEHRAPAILYAYDELLQPASRNAPVLDTVSRDQEIVGLSSTWGDLEAEVLVRTPWDGGPCAWVLARGTKEPWLGAVLPPTRIWLTPVLVVFLALLVAIGPVVRRIRRLTAAVQQAASGGYVASVGDGGGDDEIAELARAFDAAGGEVRAQLAEKDRRDEALRGFLADTTHDVMIPLTVLHGHLAALEEGLASGGPADPSVIAAAMDEAHYLGALLHNLGAAARLDAGEPLLQRAPVDLAALLGRVMGRHRPVARQHGVAIESAAPEAAISVEADTTLVEQALSNLVYNAIRHNDEGGHVAVILEAPEEGKRFRFRVIDDGPGIPPEEIPVLLERGGRGNEARSRNPEGQGLGLHIVNRVAELHGFTFSLGKSEYGGVEAVLEG